MHTDVLAGDLLNVKLVGAAGLAEVRVALAHRQIARTLLRIALRLATTAGETVLALAAALAELFAEVLRLDARTGIVARPVRVIAGREVVYVICTCNGRVHLQSN